MGNCQIKRGRELLKSVANRYTIVRNEEVDKFVRLSVQMGISVPRFKKGKLKSRKQVASDWCSRVVTSVSNLDRWQVQMASLCEIQVPLLGLCLVRFAINNRKFFDFVAQGTRVGLVGIVRLGKFDFLRDYVNRRTFDADEIDRACLVAVKKNFTESATLLGERGGRFKLKDSRGNTCLIHATTNKNLDLVRLILLSFESEKGKSLTELKVSGPPKVIPMSGVSLECLEDIPLVTSPLPGTVELPSPVVSPLTSRRRDVRTLVERIEVNAKEVQEILSGPSTSKSRESKKSSKSFHATSASLDMKTYCELRDHISHRNKNEKCAVEIAVKDFSFEILGALLKYSPNLLRKRRGKFIHDPLCKKIALHRSLDKTHKALELLAPIVISQLRARIASIHETKEKTSSGELTERECEREIKKITLLLKEAKVTLGLLPGEYTQQEKRDLKVILDQVHSSSHRKSEWDIPPGLEEVQEV